MIFVVCIRPTTKISIVLSKFLSARNDTSVETGKKTLRNDGQVFKNNNATCTIPAVSPNNLYAYYPTIRSRYKDMQMFYMSRDLDTIIISLLWSWKVWKYFFRVETFRFSLDVLQLLNVCSKLIRKSRILMNMWIFCLVFLRKWI